MQAAIVCNIQCLAGLPYPPVVKSLLRHESRNEFCHGEFLQDAGSVNYNPANGLYSLGGGPPWTLSNPVNNTPWGYFYWIALRSD